MDACSPHAVWILPVYDGMQSVYDRMQAAYRHTSDLISMVSFTFTVRRHPIRLASAPFTSFRLESLVAFRLQGSTTENLQRVGENSGPILTR